MDAEISHPLARFPKLRTGDIDELREGVSGLFSVRSIDLPQSEERLHALLNHRQIDEVGLAYVRYGAPVNVMLDHSNDYLQGFPLRGTGDAIVGRASGTLSYSRGVVGAPGVRLTLRYSPDFEHLVVRIRPEGIIRKLASLIGEPVDPPLSMTSAVVRGDAQLRLVEFVIGELDRCGDTMPSLLLAEMEQAIMVGFLLQARHNYSHRLGWSPRDAAPWQVRRAEEYIRENWDKPVTIEALAAIANTSARTLFHSFRKARGVSPMAFARRVRLAEARAMLSTPKLGASVTSVAFDCGFGNLGAFARYYQASYGELPSETLRLANGGNRPSPARAPWVVEGP